MLLSGIVGKYCVLIYRGIFLGLHLIYNKPIKTTATNKITINEVILLSQVARKVCVLNYRDVFLCLHLTLGIG